MKNFPAHDEEFAAPAWLPWRALAPAVTLSPAALAETLSGGQTFRWGRASRHAVDAPSPDLHPPKQPGEKIWQGVWANCMARMRVNRAGVLEWTCPAEISARTGPALAHYFAAEVDFDALAEELPWRTDAFLEKRLKAWRGLRLLRQPLGETLLAFLCSSAKQIPHIMQMCENLAENFGEPIWNPGLGPSQATPLQRRANNVANCLAPVCRGVACDGPPAELPKETLSTKQHKIRALPTWSRLAEVSESDLRRCALGYRARFIKETALRLAQEPGWEEKIMTAPYAEAHEWFTRLPGVGPKIADCVLLFGAAKYEAFPVDTWILRAMAERYGLRGWKPAHVAQFGRAHFGHLAGLAQQFLFSGERDEEKT